METPNFIESYETGAYELCDRIIDKLEECLRMRDDPSMQGHYMHGEATNGDSSNRRDYSFDFHTLKDPLNAEMHELLRQWIPVYAEKHAGFAMQGCISQAMKVQKTPPKGGFHTWHCEHHGSEAERNLTWTLYLNDIPEGEGETEFIEYGLKVQPKKGLLCFFPASWTHTHRGNPVYTCDKYIATGWYYLA